MKPLVLISGNTDKRGVEFGDLSLSLSNNYCQAIHAAGGVPWVLPCLPDREFAAESVRRCDGLVLTGGDDMQPKIYSEKLAPELQKTVNTAAPERGRPCSSRPVGCVDPAP